ncbi:MAG: SseB family protein [Candidatus Dadabacteria bacterium]|nr:MAG: SseB family protein [Candidatus Dadabacteria bacterium]
MAMNEKLSELLRSASLCEPEALRAFLEALTEAKLFVPSRKQKSPLTHQPIYPNDFLDVLAVQGEEKVFVPAFTDEEFATEWFGEELVLRQFTIKELSMIIPDEWWVVLNPGQEISKEFSPWEIKQLRHGKDGLDEIVSDLAIRPEPISCIEPKPGEYARIKKRLIQIAKERDEILNLYLIKEVNSAKDPPCSTALIGVEVAANCPKKMREELQNNFQREADTLAIGEDPAKVICGDKELLGIFKGSKPFYSSASFLKKVTSAFKALVGSKKLGA